MNRYRLLASSNYLFMGVRHEFGEGGRGFERSRVSVIIMVCACAAPEEGMLLALSCQAFARLLLADFE